VNIRERQLVHRPVIAMLSKNEARRIAVNIAKRPDLLRTGESSPVGEG
jgi:hypothetical protein